MPFIHTLHPGLLVILNGNNQLIVTVMQTNYKEFIRTFKEVLSVEASLRQKIITYVDAKYITSLRDHNTNSINNTIDVIIRNLFDTYVKITPQMLTKR